MTILSMSTGANPGSTASPDMPFAAGTLVLATLSNPREKFWGMLLSLSPAGIALRGIDLNSFDDFIRQLNSGEPVTAGAVFFPMHRVDRLEADVSNGEFPSLNQRFAAKTNLDPSILFAGESLS
jgi:hypothetical protein